MSDLGAQLRVIAFNVADLLRKLIDLTARVVKLEQLPWQGGGGGGGSGGGTNAFYVCMGPGSGTIAGTWSGSAPTAAGTFTATVYQVSGAAITSLGSQAVYNWLPGVLQTSKACVLIKDDNNDFGVVSQSCT
jgi:hypothetical protein